MSLVLNVGSGEELQADAVNIDIRPVADIQADARDLPYSTGSVDEVRAYDCLEHFTEFEFSDVLVEWHRVLKPGGRLVVRVPNMYRLAMMICTHADEKDGRIIDAIRNVYGGHKWGERGKFDRHEWGWTPVTLADTLLRHGFDVQRCDNAPNMTVQAVKRP